MPRKKAQSPSQQRSVDAQSPNRPVDMSSYKEGNLPHGVADTGRKDSDGRRVVTMYKFPAETSEEYYDRADKLGIGKRFVHSGRVTAMRVLRDILTGTYDNEHVVLSESDTKAIQAGRQEAERVEELPETTLTEHAQLRKQILEREAEMRQKADDEGDVADVKVEEV